MIRKCAYCKPSPAADYQDKVHGKGNRVFNPNGKGAACTCCGTQVYDLNLATPKPKKGGGGGGGAKFIVAKPPHDGWPGGLPEKNGYKVL